MKINNFILLFICSCISFFSCESYLNKAPESDISEKDVFGNWRSFQGYAEQMYQCVHDHNRGCNWNTHLFADEELWPSGAHTFDLGNYTSPECYFTGASSVVVNRNDDITSTRVWEYAWYGIAVANSVLEKLNTEGLFIGTEWERKLLEGQALFFRAWFYFEIGRYWGGMPYIQRSIIAETDFTTEEFQRTTFQETALKMVEDFRAAADILPHFWDDINEPCTQDTKGNNRERVNKVWALGYLGIAYLYAASPMINEEATGRNEFDPALCKKAAEAFGELLTLVEGDDRYYKLEPFETYNTNWCARNNNRTCRNEGIMMPTNRGPGASRNSCITAYLPGDIPGGFGMMAVPTHNITENFGDELGYRLGDPDGVWTESDYYGRRDPRLYKVVVIDGEQHCNYPPTTILRNVAELHSTGYHRQNSPNVGPKPQSYSGYIYKKHTLLGPTVTSTDLGNFQYCWPYLRLSEIYLLYAEAVNWMTDGGPTRTSGNCRLTAVDAINKLRQRCGMPNMPAKYYNTKENYFEEIVRERAVEMCFEGQRFCDLRRWNRNGDPRYLDKTSFEFDRDPVTGKPINMRTQVVVRRIAEKKHNWLPIINSYTNMFENFRQNPGW